MVEKHNEERYQFPGFFQFFWSVPGAVPDGAEPAAVVMSIVIPNGFYVSVTRASMRLTWLSKKFSKLIEKNHSQKEQRN